MNVHHRRNEVKRTVTLRLQSSTAPFPHSIQEGIKKHIRMGYKVHKYRKVRTKEQYPSGLPAYEHVVFMVR